MSYIVDNVEEHEDQIIDNGHCVRFLQEAGDLPITVSWKRGAKVKDNTSIPKGTCIATFSKDGVYENRTDGASHCAVYLGQTPEGLIVYDQWIGNPVSIRTIWFRDGKGSAANDGDQYYVIE
jgi:hypothetical protein